jgi:hypothetical protein
VTDLCFPNFQQFGGFYKHQVQKYLSGGERLFFQMGYMSTAHETLILDGPVDQVLQIIKL